MIGTCLKMLLTLFCFLFANLGKQPSLRAYLMFVFYLLVLLNLSSFGGNKRNNKLTGSRIGG